MADSESNEEFRVETPWQRYRFLILLIVVGLIVSPYMTRLLREYRGIVLAKNSGEMLVAFEKRPPRWINAANAQPGDVIQKESLSWSPKSVTAGPDDQKLHEFYQRYVREYTGVVTAITQPAMPGGASVATVRTDEGERIRFAIWSQDLATIEVGSRLRKESGQWDPVITAYRESPPARLQMPDDQKRKQN